MKLFVNVNGKQSPKYMPEGETLFHRNHFSHLLETAHWNSSPLLCYKVTSSCNTVLIASAYLSPHTMHSKYWRPGSAMVLD